MAALNTLLLGVVPSLVKYTLIRVAYFPLTRKTTLHSTHLTKEDLGINTLQGGGWVQMTKLLQLVMRR